MTLQRSVWGGVLLAGLALAGLGQFILLARSAQWMVGALLYIGALALLWLGLSRLEGYFTGTPPGSGKAAHISPFPPSETRIEEQPSNPESSSANLNKSMTDVVPDANGHSSDTWMNNAIRVTDSIPGSSSMSKFAVIRDQVVESEGQMTKRRGLLRIAIWTVIAFLGAISSSFLKRSTGRGRPEGQGVQGASLALLEARPLQPVLVDASHQPISATLPSTASPTLALPAPTSVPATRSLLQSLPVSIFLVLVELLVIVIWAFVVTRPWLNMNLNVFPIGGEYHGAIQIHNIWIQARECGWCALWYGSVGGGYPAFVDPNGSQLHPLVIFTTLGWGLLKGARVALAGSFVLAALAQWWLGHELGVGRVARVWSACMAVAACHMAARMEAGFFPLLVSTAAASLAIPALIRLSRSPNYGNSIILGIVLAQALVSGNGYLQIALLLSLPAIFVLLPWGKSHIIPTIGFYGLAGVMSLLFAAPFLLPFVHFLSEFAKDFDPNFQGAQPLAYVPLNLVISNLRFYTTPVLTNHPFPSHYVNFVGWVPVLLAMWGLHGDEKPRSRQNALFLAVFAFLAFWAATGGPQSLLAKYFPIPQLGQFLSGARYTAFMASLAVPATLYQKLHLKASLKQSSAEPFLSVPPAYVFP